MRARQRSENRRCPYCHDDVARSAAAVACSECGSFHHRECFDENGACSIFACAGEETAETNHIGAVRRAYREHRARAERYASSRWYLAAVASLSLASFVAILLALTTGLALALLVPVLLGVFLTLLALFHRLRAFVAGLIDAERRLV